MTDNSLHELKASLRECHEIISKDKQLRKEWWRRLAGPLADEMLSNREQAKRHLLDLEANIRIAALEILSFYWKENGSFASTYQTMAFNDSDSQVRAIALLRLSDCYAATNDTWLGKLLASIVLDQSNAPDFRLAAYHGLFIIRGFPLTWPGLSGRPPTEFRIPEDIDWQFVDTFLKEGEQSEQGEREQGDIVN